MVYGGLKESVRLIFSNINTFYFRFKQDSQEDKENEISSVSAISQVDTRRLTQNVKKDVHVTCIIVSFSAAWSEKTQNVRSMRNFTFHQIKIGNTQCFENIYTCG